MKQQKYYFGTKFPLTLDNSAFDEHTDVLTAVKQDIVLLIHMNKGEDLSDYQMGCSLINLLFENYDTTLENLKQTIVNQIHQYMPAVTVKKLTTSKPDSHTIEIFIEFSLVYNQQILEDNFKTQIKNS